MGFNYLQTDDRDEYLSQFNKNRNKLKISGFTLISPLGETIFENAPNFKLKTYCKKQYMPIGKSAKYIWRNILLMKGYNVINIYE